MFIAKIRAEIYWSIQDDFYCISGCETNQRQKSVQGKGLRLWRLVTEEEEKHEGQNTGSNVIKYQRKGKGKLVSSSKFTGKEWMLTYMAI